MFLTDKIVRKAFCVGGLFYPMRKIAKKVHGVFRPSHPAPDMLFIKKS